MIVEHDAHATFVVVVIEDRGIAAKHLFLLAFANTVLEKLRAKAIKKGVATSSSPKRPNPRA